MNSVMVADKTRIDAANQDAGMVGHSNLKDEIYQVVIQIK
jgi:paraquat-inducible protein B